MTLILSYQFHKLQQPDSQLPVCRFLVLLVVVFTASCFVKRKLEKRISELEAPMLSEHEMEQMDGGNVGKSRY